MELPTALTNGETVSIIVTDKAGNSSVVATLTAEDTTAPIAGTLSLSHFTDTGISTSDNIGKDKNFDLKLSGQEAGSSISYQVSTDGGTTWAETTSNQSELTDGDYQFKAIVVDKAGNISETDILKLTVDRTLSVASDVISIQNLSTIQLTDKDQTLSINLQLSDLPTDTVSTLTTIQTNIDGTTYSFAYNTNTGLWSAEIPANVLWSDKDSNNLIINLSATDQAGNTVNVKHTHTFAINHIPTTPIIELATTEGLNLDIKGMAYPGSTVKFYNSSNELIGSTITDKDGHFDFNPFEELGGTYTIFTGNEIYAIASFDGYDSAASEFFNVTHILFLSINQITATGEITGLIESGSTLIIQDKNGNVIQEFKDIYTGYHSPFDGTWMSAPMGSFSVQLKSPLAEGMEITVLATKNGFSSKSIKFTTDYTAPESPTDLSFSDDGTILTGLAEPSSFVQISNEEGSIISGIQVNADGTFSVNISDLYKSSETLSVQARDSAQNISPIATIVAPIDTTPPSAVSNIIFNENGKSFTAQVDTNSRIEITDENGNIVQSYSMYDLDSNEVTGYFENIFLKGQTLNFTAIDATGNRSPQVSATAINDTIAPEPAQNLTFIEDHLTGEAEPYTTIKIFDGYGQLIKELFTDNKGNFDGYVSQNYYQGQTLNIIVYDGADNASKTAFLEVPILENAPDHISNLSFNEYGNILSGIATAGTY